MTLRIALKDGEKVVINGAILRSVGRTELRVQSAAAILRGREIMTPEEAITPARQLYFHTMMAYIDPERSPHHQTAIIEALARVTALLPSDEANVVAMAYARNAAGMHYYRALAECRSLIALECVALADVADPATEAAAAAA